MKGYPLPMVTSLCGIGEKLVSCVSCLGGFVVRANNSDDSIPEKRRLGKIHYVRTVVEADIFYCYIRRHFPLLKGLIDFFYEDLEFSHVEQGYKLITT